MSKTGYCILLEGGSGGGGYFDRMIAHSTVNWMVAWNAKHFN